MPYSNPYPPHCACCRLLAGILSISSICAQTDFQIFQSELVGQDTIEIQAHIPETAVTYTLEFTSDPASTPWAPVYDSLIDPGDQPGQIRIQTRAAATATGYYRIAQWPGTSAPVVINEVMPNNTDTLADEDGEFVDWVELRNRSSEEINLAGFGLSDDPTAPLKWTFASTTIPADGYLIVFLSGKTREGGATNAHTNFRLSNGRDALYFSNPSGVVLDRIAPGPLRSDDSLGRNVEDILSWHEFDGTPKATPGEPNIPSGGGSLPSPFIQAPSLPIAPGFYDGPTEVAVQPSHPGDLVYYTLDGSEPDRDTSAIADGPFVLDQTTVVRAITVGVDGNESESVAGTYFVGVDHTLPIISISADPDNFEFRNGRLYGFGDRLFSRTGRIIGNFPWSNSNAWQNREISANIEMYEDDKSQAFNEVLGLKIFGGWGSRGYAQKSFAVFARSRRGTGRIQHQLFPDKEITSFESFVLRNSGNDNQSTHLTVPRSEIRAFSQPASYGSYFVNGNFTLFRDAMLGSLARDIGLDTQGYRPSVVYINGEYWGIYNIREKLNEHYVESNHGVPENQVDLIEGYGSANSGSGAEYSRMRSYISGRNMSDPERYQFVQDNYLHIDNFIDYHLSVIFFQNFDIGNIKCWRPRIDGGKFRWLVYDQDYGFNLWKPDVYLPAMKRDFSDYDNMFEFYTNPRGSGTGWPNDGGRTVLLRKLLANDQFKSQFILRCADLLNSTFSTEYVTARIDEMAAPIRSEIPDHLARWNWAGIQQRGFDHPYKEEDAPLTPELWESHVQVMRDYAAARPTKLRSDLISHFELEMGTGEVRVTIDPPDSGSAMVNSIAVTGTADAPWTGTYFEEYPPPLTPLPKPGWTLNSWFGDVTDTDGTIFANVSANSPSNITANFEPATPDPANTAIVLTEIQYHPADQQPGGEWIEIWNSGDAELAVAGWKVYDDRDDNVFVIPDSTTLAANARLVLAFDPEAFATAYPDVSNVLGGFTFRLGNGGDSVRLVDASGAIVETITYDDRSPWPEAADGDGYTLTRIVPIAASDEPTSWNSSADIGGTPGT